MTEQKCATCRYWKAGGSKEYGNCRRRSPGLPESQPTGYWPATHFEAWCGDWEQREKPAQEPKVQVARVRWEETEP